MPTTSALDFTCRHETKPPLSPDTQALYNYALYHDLHNMWRGKKGDPVWQAAAVYYRIAAANGDYKANIRLQYLVRSGRVIVREPMDEVYQLNRALEKILPATAYYHFYQYLSRGYGIKTEKGGHYAYLRKAADMGNAEAQYIVGNAIIEATTLESPDRVKRFEIAEKMQVCSSEQGFAKAGMDLAMRARSARNYSESVKLFHQSVKGGGELSAFSLELGFNKRTTPENKVDYLALKPDAERSLRYKMIGDFLFRNDYLEPKVPDLDKIVPLPPAKLPAWDGKIAFQRWYEGPSPAKPSDELMQKLADKAGLDVKTGLPLQKK
ncbi:sel1 repeat family protein [Aggregatibacter actinomycetemcomitans]|nr:sel1 repeat family protein [Aggregatibacter actinomycetemcomitans]